ncbi:MAG: SpoIIE family protein phosphatase [Desulfobacterales bacterium]|jgi:sigma-B regulation protein RsbU (phosphoserine phosphatase)
MTKFAVFRLKNEMLITNFIANVFGVGVVLFLTYRSTYQGSEEVFWLVSRIGWAFDPFLSILIFILTLKYERPIRIFFNKTAQQEPISNKITIQARRRLLNEPFFLIVLDLSVWFVAAVLYSVVFWISDAERDVVFITFFQCLQTGLITSVAAFFLLRSVLQRRLVPHLFPAGGLYKTYKTLRIRIGTRLAALVLACNLVPFFAIITITSASHYSNLEPAVILEQLRSNIFVNSLIFMVVGILLTILVVLNLRQPFQNIFRVLMAVRKGDFNKKVRVTSNDEIGYTGDVINEMTEGLKERDRMRHSLELAKEVQQNFMPKSDPRVMGLDIAGRSQYCERTGGDYYDYLETGRPEKGKIGVVIGDVSGHGISAALLMATARSALRQRVLSGGDAGQIVSDINCQLSRDVEDSCRFMTLFYCQVDARNHHIHWVRAGHDPAILYDPETETFEELKGRGMALGIDENWQYEENQKTGLKKGQIVVLGTDGIWEAHNARGEMFGKDVFYEILHRNATKPATQILEAVYSELASYQIGVAPEDDVTMVVIKIESE